MNRDSLHITMPGFVRLRPQADSFYCHVRVSGCVRERAGEPANPITYPAPNTYLCSSFSTHSLSGELLPATPLAGYSSNIRKPPFEKVGDHGWVEPEPVPDADRRQLA